MLQNVFRSFRCRNDARNLDRCCFRNSMLVRQPWNTRESIKRFQITASRMFKLHRIWNDEYRVIKVFRRVSIGQLREFKMPSRRKIKLIFLGKLCSSMPLSNSQRQNVTRDSKSERNYPCTSVEWY